MLRTTTKPWNTANLNIPVADGASDSAYGIGTYALALFSPMQT